MDRSNRSYRDRLKSFAENAGKLIKKGAKKIGDALYITKLTPQEEFMKEFDETGSMWEKELKNTNKMDMSRKMKMRDEALQKIRNKYKK